MLKQALTLALLLSSAFMNPVWSQDKKASGAEPEQEAFSYLMPGLFYVSDAVFMGRRDSVAAPYLMPSLGYYHKSGVYAEGSASYLLATGEGRIDLIMVGGGYQFQKGNFSGNLSGTAYLFNDQSYNVKSETLGDLTLKLGYDWDWVESTLSFSSYLNREGDPDYFLGIGFSHSWTALNDRLYLQPGLSLYAGTQRFYEAYFNSSRMGNRKGTGPGTGLPQTGSEMVNLEEASSFEVLNLELEFPAHYFYRHFVFSLYPSLSFPQSPVTIETEEGGVKEDLDPTFYIIAGVSFWVGGS
ncbi:MAG: hypothetical protein P8Z38_07155 [Robiginitalea sp.]